MNKKVEESINSGEWEKFDPATKIPFDNDVKWFSYILEADVALPDGDSDEIFHLKKLNPEFILLVNSMYDETKPKSNVLYYKLGRG